MGRGPRAALCACSARADAVLHAGRRRPGPRGRDRAGFADAPHAINLKCNEALDDEDKRTIEADLLLRCRALDVPVLVVHGSHDPRPRSALDGMLAALPRAEFVLMDGVGHLPWLEDPASFGSILRDFVTRVAALQRHT